MVSSYGFVSGESYNNLNPREAGTRARNMCKIFSVSQQLRPELSAFNSLRFTSHQKNWKNVYFSILEIKLTKTLILPNCQVPNTCPLTGFELMVSYFTYFSPEIIIYRSKTGIILQCLYVKIIKIAIWVGVIHEPTKVWKLDLAW